MLCGLGEIYFVDKIRILLQGLLLGLTLGCTGEVRAQPWSVGWPAGTRPSPLSNRHPVMPGLHELAEMAPYAHDVIIPAHGGLDGSGRPAWAHQVRRMDARHPDRAFTGWCKHILTDTDHRWRFQRYEQGWLVEQVAYHADGTPDHHYHMDTLGRNVGSQRLWYPDGSPYIDRFRDEEGRFHGRQLKWSADGRMDWDVMYRHGTAIDAEGRPIPEDRLGNGDGGC